jgi:predicted ATPase
MSVLERAARLATLSDLVDRVGDGGRLVLIAGKAGAGKSALVDPDRPHRLRPLPPG